MTTDNVTLTKVSYDFGVLKISMSNGRSASVELCPVCYRDGGQPIERVMERLDAMNKLINNLKDL